MAPSNAAAPAPKPPSALERTQDRLKHRIEAAQRLCRVLGAMRDRSSLLYAGPRPATPQAPEAPKPAGMDHVDHLEQELADLLDRANALAESLGEFLP